MRNPVAGNLIRTLFINKGTRGNPVFDGFRYLTYAINSEVKAGR